MPGTIGNVSFRDKPLLWHRRIISFLQSLVVRLLCPAHKMIYRRLRPIGVKNFQRETERAKRRLNLGQLCRRWPSDPAVGCRIAVHLTSQKIFPAKIAKIDDDVRHNRPHFHKGFRNARRPFGGGNRRLESKRKGNRHKPKVQNRKPFHQFIFQQSNQKPPTKQVVFPIAEHSKLFTCFSYRSSFFRIAVCL